MMRLLLPRTATGCFIGMVAVTGIGLGILHLHHYLPASTDPYLALGIPSVGGAGLLLYLYRLIYLDTPEAE